MPFLDIPVKRGEVTRSRVQIGEFLDGTPISLPVVTIGGTNDGPVLYMQAGLHGDEQTGIAALRQTLGQVSATELSGTVVAVPVVNVPAHLSRTRGFLHEERWLIDCNRIFPGSPDGLISQRIVHTVFSEFIEHADLTIDFHSALDGCDIMPWIHLGPDSDENGTLAYRERMANAFGFPLIYRMPTDARLGTSDLSRSINATADRIGKPLLLAEMGESRRVSNDLLPQAVNGIARVMGEMGMIEREPDLPAESRYFSSLTLVHAQHGGALETRVRLGDEVEQGDLLAVVLDVFGRKVEAIEAPADGVVLRLMLLGAVATGAEVLWIAS